MLSAATAKTSSGAAQRSAKVKACTYMLPRPRRSMFHPNTQKVHDSDRAATVGSSARSNSPPAHSGLLTTTLPLPVRSYRATALSFTVAASSSTESGSAIFCPSGP
ncbi:hypothetical protein VPH35_096902 [Triticum aestivum]